MDGNAELLNFIYQNSQMGVDTIQQLLNITKDEKFEVQMDKQLAGYKEFHKTAQEMLNKNGYDEKGIGTFEKLKTYLMINFQTLNDASTSHIAEMMIVGSNMGITDAIKNIHKYDDAEKDILQLMDRLKSFEEDNVERLKKFL